MSAARRPRPDTSPMRASNTASIACCSAGNGCSPRLRKLLPAPLHVVPQQAGQHEARRHRASLGHAPVGVGQCELDEACALRRAALLVEHGAQHGEHALVQSVPAQRLDAGQRMAGLQQLDHLVEQPRHRHVGQQRDRFGHGGGGLLFDLEAELGGEAHRAHQAHRVFAVARGRVADHAQHAPLGIGQAVVKVDHDARFGVVVHRVDGEVAPRRILDLRAPHVVAQHAAAGIDHVGLADQVRLRRAFVALDLIGLAGIAVGAEGRHLDHFVLATAAEHHVHEAEAPSDDEGAPKQRLHLLGRGVGGHVEVLRPPAHQQVAHRTADDVGLVAGRLQRADDLDRMLIDQRVVDAMLVGANVDALAQRHARGFAQQFVNESFDHQALRTGAGYASRARARSPRAPRWGWWPPAR